jgi:hypothetical protein
MRIFEIATNSLSQFTPAPSLGAPATRSQYFSEHIYWKFRGLLRELLGGKLGAATLQSSTLKIVD